MAGGLALALSGGGARGAFQVGVLDELINNRNIDFKIAAGTSTGAIQAAAVAQKDVPGLVRVWESIRNNRSIYHGSDKPLAAAWAVIRGKPALFRPGPLKKLLNDFYDDKTIGESDIKLRLTIVNIATGELRVVGNKAGRFADWVYASSAQPPFFPPMEDSAGNKWVDGGVRDIIPLNAALKERPRAVLVVRAEAPLPVSHEDFDNLVEIGLQSVELLTREVARGDVGNVELMNDLLKAADAQRQRLAQFNLTPDQIEQAMEPFQSCLDEYDMTPTFVIGPEEELYPRLHFDHDLILENIQRGRDAVCAKWHELGPFLGA